MLYESICRELVSNLEISFSFLKNGYRNYCDCGSDVLVILLLFLGDKTVRKISKQRSVIQKNAHKVVLIYLPFFAVEIQENIIYSNKKIEENNYGYVNQSYIKTQISGTSALIILPNDDYSKVYLFTPQTFSMQKGAVHLRLIQCFVTEKK